MVGAPLALVLPQEFTSRHLYIMLLPRMMRYQSLQEGLLPWRGVGKHRKAGFFLSILHWAENCPLPISWLYQLEHLSLLCPSQPKLPPGGNVMVPPSPILIRRRPGLGSTYGANDQGRCEEFSPCHSFCVNSFQQ